MTCEHGPGWCEWGKWGKWPPMGSDYWCRPIIVHGGPDCSNIPAQPEQCCVDMVGAALIASQEALLSDGPTLMVHNEFQSWRRVAEYLMEVLR